MAAGWLTYVYWCFGTGTGAEKSLFRRIRRLQPRRIVEVGISSLERTSRLISAAQRYAQGDAIRYTGIDWFEERRPPMGPLPLIHAYRELQANGATVRLMPGAPSSVLPQAANVLQRTDLLLISSNVSDRPLERAWFYVPRMCQTGTVVLRERQDGEHKSVKLVEIPAAEIALRAAKATPRQAA